VQTLPIHPLLQNAIAEAYLTRHESVITYRVMPSIYTVMGFQISGRIDHVTENRALSTFGVTGILDGWRAFRSHEKTRSLLLFFKPGGFYRIFGAAAGELGSASLALADVVPLRVHRSISAILEAPGSFSDKWQRVQHGFLQLSSRELSPEAMGILYHLQAHQGQSRIGDIAKHLSVSRRTLERRFAAEIGTAPKHLARIMRWRNAMKNLPKYTDLGRAALAHGFFDQAHFIRETHVLGGATPSELRHQIF